MRKRAALATRDGERQCRRARAGRRQAGQLILQPVSDTGAGGLSPVDDLVDLEQVVRIAVALAPAPRRRTATRSADSGRRGRRPRSACSAISGGSSSPASAFAIFDRLERLRLRRRRARRSRPRHSRTRCARSAPCRRCACVIVGDELRRRAARRAGSSTIPSPTCRSAPRAAGLRAAPAPAARRRDGTSCRGRTAPPASGVHHVVALHQEHDDVRVRRLRLDEIGGEIGRAERRQVAADTRAAERLAGSSTSPACSVWPKA